MAPACTARTGRRRRFQDAIALVSDIQLAIVATAAAIADRRGREVSADEQALLLRPEPMHLLFARGLIIGAKSGPKSNGAGRDVEAFAIIMVCWIILVLIRLSFRGIVGRQPHLPSREAADVRVQMVDDESECELSEAVEPATFEANREPSSDNRVKLSILLLLGLKPPP